MKAAAFAKEVHLILSVKEFYYLGSLLDDQFLDDEQPEFKGIWEKMLAIKSRLDTEINEQ